MLFAVLNVVLLHNLFKCMTLAYCRKHESSKKASKCFIQHEKSNVHRVAVVKRSYLTQPSVAAQLSNQVMQQQKLNREMLIKQLSSLRYLLR